MRQRELIKAEGWPRKQLGVKEEPTREGKVGVGGKEGKEEVGGRRERREGRKKRKVKLQRSN